MNAVGFVDAAEMLRITVTDFGNKHKHRHKYINQHLPEDIQ